MSFIQVHIADPDFRSRSCPLKFTLSYEGILRTSQRGRAEQRPALRKHFHKQLKRLWQVNPFLKGWLMEDGFGKKPVKDWVQTIVPVVNGIKFIPLIIPSLAIECALEFRIFRSTERDGNIADADNQIKVILDALKMPQDSGQIGSVEDYENCNPLFTLAQDDKLITKLSSISDEMLTPPMGWETFDPKLCRIYIDVYIRPRLPTPENIIFFDDDQKAWDYRYSAAIPEGLSGMSNEQLKATTTQCIFRISALAQSIEGYHETQRNIENYSFKDYADRMMEDSQLRRQIWQSNLWPKAFSLREELCRRIYGEPPYPIDYKSSIAIALGSLAGPHPIADPANDLNRLVMRFI